MTDTDLRIKIARAKGWTEIGDVFDELQGWSPASKPGYLPDYPGDPREFVPLFFELPQPASITHGRDGFTLRTGGMVYRGDDLGCVICEARIAMHAARSGEGE